MQIKGKGKEFSANQRNVFVDGVAFKSHLEFALRTASVSVLFVAVVTLFIYYDTVTALFHADVERQLIAKSARAIVIGIYEVAKHVASQTTRYIA
jgi:hypothetical protein